MSVRQAQSEIDSAEFTEWIAFYRTGFDDAGKTNILLATIASSLINVFQPKGKKAVRVDDLLPEIKKFNKKSNDMNALKNLARALSSAGIGKLTEAKKHGDNRST